VNHFFSNQTFWLTENVRARMPTLDESWAEIVGPGLLAALVAIFVTIAIEKLGGRKGGLIGTLPSTILPAVWGFMVRSPDTESFQTAAFSAPFGMWLNVVFLYLWRFLPKRVPLAWGRFRLVALTIGTLSIWMFLAVTLVSFMQRVQLTDSLLLTCSCLCTLVMAVMGVLACRHMPNAPKGSKRIGPMTLMARGIFAGLSIGVAVWLADQGGAVAAGVAAVFPAIYMTTMVSLFVSQGENVQAGAVGPMMLGSTSIAVYAISAAFILPALGVIIGSLVSWAIAVSFTSLPAWIWLNRRPRQV
jgi:hypothetical protein